MYSTSSASRICASTKCPIRAFAITGIVTDSWISRILSGSAMRATPPCARMSAGTRSRAITATAPASSAIRACSAVVTSMITPPLSISARPPLTRIVPSSAINAILALRRDAERVAELGARADPELAVDVAQVDLDGLRRHEQRLRDVLVRHVLGSHLGDAALARRQRLGAGEDELARPRAGRGELGLRVVDERLRAGADGEIEPLAEELPRLGALVRAP